MVTLFICFVIIIFGLGPLTLNELTPEEAAQYLEAAQRHSSRGSIPVMVEEPKIIPTPDVESEDGSEEENEGNSVESKRESEEESEPSDIRGSEEENEGNIEQSENESEIESEPSTPPTRSRRRCRSPLGTPSPGRRWEERRRAHNLSAERQSLSRSQSEESNADNTKSDLSLGE